MKYSVLTLEGKKHVLAFTARAAEKAEEKCGDIAKLGDLDGSTVGKSLTNTMWLIAVLMEAGKKYADRNGIECAEPISYDELMDDYGIDDLAVFNRAIGDAMSNGQTTTVNIEQPKNANGASRLG